MLFNGLFFVICQIIHSMYFYLIDLGWNSNSCNSLQKLKLMRLLFSFRRRMYFTSCLLTIFALVGVATFNFLLNNFDFEPEVSTALKWLTLTSAGMLVFAVQLGVQTLPTLLSGRTIATIPKLS